MFEKLQEALSRLTHGSEEATLPQLGAITPQRAIEDHLWRLTHWSESEATLPPRPSEPAMIGPSLSEAFFGRASESRPEPTRTSSEMWNDLHRRYPDWKLPEEQTRALFKDVPQQLLDDHGITFEDLRRVACAAMHQVEEQHRLHSPLAQWDKNDLLQVMALGLLQHRLQARERQP